MMILWSLLFIIIGIVLARWGFAFITTGIASMFGGTEKKDSDE